MVTPNELIYYLCFILINIPPNQKLLHSPKNPVLFWFCKFYPRLYCSSLMLFSMKFEPCPFTTIQCSLSLWNGWKFVEKERKFFVSFDLLATGRMFVLKGNKRRKMIFRSRNYI